MVCALSSWYCIIISQRIRFLPHRIRWLPEYVWKPLICCCLFFPVNSKSVALCQFIYFLTAFSRYLHDCVTRKSCTNHIQYHSKWFFALSFTLNSSASNSIILPPTVFPLPCQLASIARHHTGSHLHERKTWFALYPADTVTQEVNASDFHFIEYADFRNMFENP